MLKYLDIKIRKKATCFLGLSVILSIMQAPLYASINPTVNASLSVIKSDNVVPYSWPLQKNNYSSCPTADMFWATNIPPQSHTITVLNSGNGTASNVIATIPPPPPAMTATFTSTTCTIAAGSTCGIVITYVSGTMPLMGSCFEGTITGVNPNGTPTNTITFSMVGPP
jgi:hypothetical protein